MTLEKNPLTISLLMQNTNIRSLVVFSLLFTSSLLASPCDDTAGWRATVCTFAKGALKHPAWGYEHGMRDYLLTKELVQKDAIPSTDDDVLFASAMLHDMGAFPPYEKEGVDHADRSAEVVGDILLPAGFPPEKLERVKKAILTHSYYSQSVPETSEALALHDADTLDFLGTIGAARLLSAVGNRDGFPDMAGAIQVLKKFTGLMPSKIHGGAWAKAEAARRATELGAFLESLHNESFGIDVH